MNPEMPIREIMTTQLITAVPNTSMKEVQSVFARHNIHHLPVVDECEAIIGIISKEDLYKITHLLALNTSGPTYSEKMFRTLTARDLMTPNPMVLDPDDSIGLAADIFLANKFHALPIVENDRLVGIVTTHDLLAFAFDKTGFNSGETPLHLLD